MKVEVGKVPDDGVWMEQAETAKDLALDYPLCNFKDPIKQNLFVSKVSGDLLAQGTVQTEVHFQCSRCLNDFVYPVELKKFTFCEPIQERLIIDLTNSVSEDIILTLPTKPLCREDCKGLCPQCGKNLNVGSCKCQKGPKDLRLADLDKLKFD